MSNRDYTFLVRFWGATGSFANPLPPSAVEQKLARAIRILIGRPEFRQRLDEFARDAAALAHFIESHVPYAVRSTFGGNTTCIEIQAPDALIIVDAGSGFRRLGQELARRWDAADYHGDRTGHVLMTHSHLDHTFATPFVDPYYDPRNCFQIWAPHKVVRSLQTVFSPKSSLRSVFIPHTSELLAGVKRFTTIQAGDEFAIGNTRIRTCALDHPGGCLAYRLEQAGKSVVIATDHEHRTSPDRDLAAFARGADLLYLDAQYLDAEYQGHAGLAGEPPHSRRGWGHSTIEAVIPTGVSAGVRRLILGHHDPKRTDERLAELETLARQQLATALQVAGLPTYAMELHFAREEQVVEI